MRRWIISIIGIVILAGSVGAWWWLRKSTGIASDLRTTTVRAQTVTQDTAFTGRLTPQQSSDISFELPGTVIALLVEEGATVERHQPLAVLDTSSAALELAQARATTLSAQEQTKLAFTQAATELTQTRTLNETTIAKRRQAVIDAKREVDQAKQVHQQQAGESGDTAAATESAIAAVRAAETIYHAAQTALTETLATVEQSNTSAAAAVATARTKYLATIQPAGSVAGLSSLEATEALAANRVQQHTLTAPFAGTVTTRHKTVGEAALAGTPVVTIATTDQLELSATVTETDAVKLTVGMPASITFDALPATDQWTGSVTYISPAATVIEGVSTYTVKLALHESLERLRPGLTANITVHAAARENVIAIPRRAITTQGTQEFVAVVQNNGTISTQPISTGLVGSDGTVEVTRGLTAGETVVLNPGQISRHDDGTHN